MNIRTSWKVVGILFLLLFTGTCLGAVWWRTDADSTPAPAKDADIACFIGRILGHDSTVLHPIYAVRYLEGVKPATDSSWGAPMFPYVLVCARFPQDSAEVPVPAQPTAKPKMETDQ